MAVGGQPVDFVIFHSSLTNRKKKGNPKENVWAVEFIFRLISTQAFFFRSHKSGFAVSGPDMHKLLSPLHLSVYREWQWALLYSMEMKSRKFDHGSQKKVFLLSACRISMLNACRQTVSEHCGNNKRLHAARKNLESLCDSGPVICKLLFTSVN